MTIKMIKDILTMAYGGIFFLSADSSNIFTKSDKITGMLLLKKTTQMCLKWVKF